MIALPKVIEPTVTCQICLGVYDLERMHGGRDVCVNCHKKIKCRHLWLYEVVITDTTNGRVGFNKYLDAQDDGSDFYWTEGNGSCDCNRCLIVYPETRTEDLKCGETRFQLTSLTVTRLGRMSHDVLAAWYRDNRP